MTEAAPILRLRTIQQTSRSSHRELEIDALLRIGEAMAASPDLAGLMDGVHRALGGVIDLSTLVIANAEEATGELLFPWALIGGERRQLGPVSLYRDDSLAAEVTRQGEEVVGWPGDGSGAEPEIVPGVGLPPVFAALPLVSQGRMAGALLVGNEGPRRFSAEDIRLLHLVSTQVSVALQKAKLHQALVRHARSLEERVLSRTSELEAEKIRFESTVQSLSEGLVLLDLDRAVTFANERALGLVDLPLEAVLGMRADDLVLHGLASQEDDRRRFEAALRDLESLPELTFSSGLEDAEASGAAPAARPRWVQARLFPVRDAAGILLGGGLILQDITREREMDRMKDELVNVVSHELRTPLSSVIGFAELLLAREFPPERRRQIVETIYNEADRLSSLINAFLDLRRLESGRGSLNLAEVSLEEVVRSVAAGLDPLQGNHNLRLELSPLETFVRADRERLGQTIRNLIANAFKYSPDGGEVRVRVAVQGGEAVVTVTDRGLGLPPEAIPSLFQKFYRVDSSDRREIGGTGLGLAIVREIVQAHGGRVWAESPGPGQGSTFGFSLPLLRSPGCPQRKCDGPEVPSGSYVLLVERDPGQADLLREYLEQAGFAVLVVSDEGKALEAARTRLPIGVILEIPDVNPESAWTLLSLLRTMAGPIDLPIVLVSAADQDALPPNSGATAVLTRPFDPRSLLKILERSRRTALVIASDFLLMQNIRNAVEQGGLTARCLAPDDDLTVSAEGPAPKLAIVEHAWPRADGLARLDTLRSIPKFSDLPVVLVALTDLDEPQVRLIHKHRACRLLGRDFTPARLRALVEEAIGESDTTDRSPAAGGG